MCWTEPTAKLLIGRVKSTLVQVFGFLVNWITWVRSVEFSFVCGGRSCFGILSSHAGSPQEIRNARADLMDEYKMQFPTVGLARSEWLG